MWTAKVLICLEFFWESWVPEPRKNLEAVEYNRGWSAHGGSGVFGGGGECSHSLNEEFK